MSARSKQVAPKGSAKAASTKGKRVTKVVAAEVPQIAVETPRASIRQTIRQAIVAGRSTPEISATLTELFPTTMAAQKAGKHIAYYRSQLKKEAKAAVAA